MNLSFDDLKDFLDKAKTVYDLVQDMKMEQDNIHALRTGNTGLIRERLDKSIARYGDTINMLSLFTNVRIVYDVQVTDEHAAFSLYYLTTNIPLYVAWETVREELIKRFLGAIGFGI